MVGLIALLRLCDPLIGSCLLLFLLLGRLIPLILLILAVAGGLRRRSGLSLPTLRFLLRLPSLRGLGLFIFRGTGREESKGDSDDDGDGDAPEGKT